METENDQVQQKSPYQIPPVAPLKKKKKKKNQVHEDENDSSNEQFEGLENTQPLSDENNLFKKKAITPEIPKPVSFQNLPPINQQSKSLESKSQVTETRPFVETQKPVQTKTDSKFSLLKKKISKKTFIIGCVIAFLVVLVIILLILTIGKLTFSFINF